MGYPVGPLKNRSVYKPGLYAVISNEGRVFNTIPGIKNCELSIVCSPKMGAQAVHIVGKVLKTGETTLAYAAECGVESFLYVMDGKGELEITSGKTTSVLKQGGYIYSPPSNGISFRNTGKDEVQIYLYKQRFTPHPDPTMPLPKIIVGDANQVLEYDYMDMTNVHLRDLLPVNEGMDMNMHILAFDPGGCHPFVETHVQEHGAYILEGQAVYLLDKKWQNVQAEDFIWFAPFVQQACYGTGLGRITYIYSKDCHRDEKI